MSIRDEIVEYVRNGLDSGHSLDVLKDALKDAGWHIHDIEESIIHATGNVVSTPFKKKDMGFLEKTVMVLKKPHEFFDSISGDGGYSDALKYYLIISVLIVAANAMLFTIIFTAQFQAFAASGFLGGQGALDATNAAIISFIPGMFVMMYAISILTTLVGAGLLHYIFIRPLGGKGEDHQTYKAVCYSLAPAAISSIISILIMLPLVFTTITPEALFSVLIIETFVMLPFLTWTTVLEAIGISRLHGVTFKRALTMISIPWILIVLFYVIQFIYAGI